MEQVLQESTEVGKVPFWVKLGYGIGDIGSNFFIVVTGFFLLFFLTDIVGVEPALAGLVLLIPKLWDVISDPIMGALSDRTRSKWGRRRPYLLYGALPFGLTFFLMFLERRNRDTHCFLHFPRFRPAAQSFPLLAL